MPKLSIITINRNNAEGLRKTIESVVSQTFTDFEYIVIDGNSSDDSVSVIKEYESRIHYWVSEPDKGIYNAMNKGIVKASGDYLLMLNSGDSLYEDTTLEKVITEGLHEDIVYGDVYYLSNSGNFHTTYPDKINFGIFLKHGIHHQSVFVRNQLHNTVGLYNESLNIVSDWCFFVLAFCRCNCSYKHIHVFVSICPRDGISCDPLFWPKIVEEREQFLKNEFPAFLADYELFTALQLENKILKEQIVSLNSKSIRTYIKRILKKMPFVFQIINLIRNKK